MTVVDASIVVTALVRGEYADWAVGEHLSTAGAGRLLYAPHLLDVEVGHALRRRVAARKLRDNRRLASGSEMETILPVIFSLRRH